MKKFDVVIIGGGAAGLMCAVEAGKRGRKVLLLDHAPKIGSKILISGGGRCNFTNVGVSPQNYVSENPDFCRSALARFGPADFIALVEKHSIPYYEKKLGQLFCRQSAQAILTLLLTECQEAGARVVSGVKVERVDHDPQGFKVYSTLGRFSCRSLVVATGGLSLPKTGATGFGYDLARQFGISVVIPTPALDGFVWNETDALKWQGLEGISLEVGLTAGGQTFRENILFTHKGLSGPAALQGSLYWNQGKAIHIDLLPEREAKAWLLKQKNEKQKEIKNALGEFFPIRFAEKFTDCFFPQGKRCVSLSLKEIEVLANNLKAWTILPQSTVGFSKAEVTKGGVDTRELSSKTMECLKVSGLYFVGEVVDVTGWLGGYNFQWAWSSGWVAGQYV